MESTRYHTFEGNGEANQLRERRGSALGTASGLHPAFWEGTRYSRTLSALQTAVTGRVLLSPDNACRMAPRGRTRARECHASHP